MLIDIIKQSNWVDIFVIILFFRICYISYKTGFSISLFKLLGTLAALYLAMHYYTWVSDLLTKVFSLKAFPLEFLDFLCFVFLVLFGYLIFVFLRMLLNRFMRMEALPSFNNWVGLLLGAGRGILVVALFVFMMVISTVSYLKKSIVTSYIGPRIFEIAPDTYSWIWGNIVSKFAVTETYNQAVSEIEKDFVNQ